MPRTVSANLSRRTSTLRVALIGFGFAGRVLHGPLVDSANGLEIRAIVSGDPDRREQARADFPEARLLKDVAEVWSAAADFDLVVIASPNAAHFGQAVTALHNGLHVVVDKPLAGSSEEALAIAEAALNSCRQVHTFQNRRWDSDFLTVRSIVDSGALGQIRVLESRMESMRGLSRTTWKDSAKPEDMGGVLLDLGSHLVDQAIQLLGPVEEVKAQMHNVRQLGTAEDHVQLQLTHACGITSRLIASRASASDAPRFVVSGDRGELRITHVDSQEKELQRGARPEDSHWGTEPPTAFASLRITMANGEIVERQHRLERGRWDTFYPAVRRAIMDEGLAPVPLQQAIENLRVIDAARLSSEIGKSVKLPGFGSPAAPLI